MEDENVLSIADICRIIFSQKWLALILAVVITVFGIIGITYVYNPRVSVYTVKFCLNLPGKSDGGAYYLYPDGNILYYNSLVSEENLLAVKKNGGDAFSGINVEKMIGGNVTFTSEMKAGDENKETGKYILKVKKSCFKNDDEARAFLKAVTEIPVNHFDGMSVDAYRHLNYNKDAVNYDTEVNNISNQINHLKSEYRTLANSYGYNFIVAIDGQDRSLQSYLIDLDAFLDTGVITGILADIEEKGCVKNEESKAKYKIEKNELKGELDKANETLNNIKDIAAPDNTQVIKEQYDLVHDLDKKIAVLQKYIDGVPDEGIEKQIKALYDEVSGFTETYEQVLGAVYKKLAFVTYDDPNIITSVGGIGITLTVIGSLAAGVIIAIAAAYFVGLPKYRKKTSPQTSQGEPPAAIPFGGEADTSKQDET